MITSQTIMKSILANMSKTSKKLAKQFTEDELDELIDEAIVDAYDEYEQRIGFLTMIQDNVTVPFQASLHGSEVTVSEIDGTDRVIKAIIKENKKSYPVDILDVEIDPSAVKGGEWIMAYRKWEGGN